MKRLQDDETTTQSREVLDSSIDKEVYGDRHPSVATRLNNIGRAWDALGDAKKSHRVLRAVA